MDGVVKPLESSLVHCVGLKYIAYWKYLGKVDRGLTLHLIPQGVRESSIGCSLSKLRRKWTVWDPQASGVRTVKASLGLKARWANTLTKAAGGVWLMQEIGNSILGSDLFGQVPFWGDIGLPFMGVTKPEPQVAGVFFSLRSGPSENSYFYKHAIFFFFTFWRHVGSYE